MQIEINEYFTHKTIINNGRQYSYLDDNELNFDKAVSGPENVYILDHLCAIKITGEDAKTFLQGQLTTDLTHQSIAPISCYLSRKGRIISLFYITEHSGHYYLFMPNDISDIFIGQLKKYLFKSKVNIDKLNTPVISISPELKNAFISDDLPCVTLDDEVLLISNETMLQQIKEKRTSLNIQGSWAWHKKQLQNHMPSIYPETVAKFLMHEINLHQSCAIDFKKGCFIGQEIVARMQYKSKIQYQIKFAKIDPIIRSTLNESLSLDETKNYLVLDQINNDIDTYCLLSHKH